MDAGHDSNDLSLEQIQALLLAKQRQLTERKLVRVTQAQETDRFIAPQSGIADHQPARPSRSPESWRGAEGQDRFFRPAALAPLDASLTLSTPTPVATTMPKTEPRRYPWRDRLLLIGEIVALAAFLTILGASFRRTRDLNSEYRQAQRTRVAEQISAPVSPQATAFVPITATPISPAPSRQATRTLSATSTPKTSAPIGLPFATTTITPTLSATAVNEPPPLPLLTSEPTPSGLPTLAPTTTPLALPGIRPSQSETPAVIGLPTAAPTDEVATAPGLPLRIEIPVIEVDAPVVQGDTWEPLKLGVGHRIGSALPGEIGNVVMSAHNDIYGEIFRQLRKLEPGDLVRVHTSTKSWHYEVISVEIVSPSRVDLMDPTDTPILTLITCYPYLLDTHRVVVRAALAL